MPKVRNARHPKCNICKEPMTDCRDRKTGEYGVCCGTEDCFNFSKPRDGLKSNYEAETPTGESNGERA